MRQGSSAGCMVFWFAFAGWAFAFVGCLALYTAPNYFIKDPLMGILVLLGGVVALAIAFWPMLVEKYLR